ncbi:MAG: hypothetical protein H6Q05_716 [Acidobacteria bacterium]|jgi:general secretion pathway protein I|nr:hypothetical protein [Acidobacteriota bacterium]
MKRESGFTLLEVLVALTVLAVGAALILSLISGSLGNIRKVRARGRAIEHARTVMELALLDGTVSGPTTMQGDFEDGTRWTVTVTEVEMPVPESVMQGVQTAQMPVRLLGFAVDVMEPNAAAPSFQLQTMKVVSALDATGAVRVPR